MAIVTGLTIYEWFSPNAASFTLANYVAAAGVNRLLMVCGLFQRNAVTDFTITVTYDGVALTSAVQQTTTSTSRWLRAGIWYRVLGDSASDTTASVVATSSGTLAGAILCAQMLSGVNQASPLLSAHNSTAMPSVLNLGYETGGPDGPFAFWAAAAPANQLGWSVASPDVTPTGVFSLGPTPSDATEITGAGYRHVWPAGADNMSAVTITRSGSPPSQVAVAAKFRPAVSTVAHVGHLVNARRLKSKTRGLI